MPRLVFGESPPPPAIANKAPWRVRHAANLAAGVHPLTLQPLKTDGTTCGNCLHMVRLKYAGTYSKCTKGPLTHGPATDCRKRWPACALYEPATEADPQRTYYPAG